MNNLEYLDIQNEMSSLFTKLESFGNKLLTTEEGQEKLAMVVLAHENVRNFGIVLAVESIIEAGTAEDKPKAWKKLMDQMLEAVGVLCNE